MKKLSVLLLASAFVFSVAGCNSSGNSDDGDGGSQGGSLDGAEPAAPADGAMNNAVTDGATMVMDTVTGAAGKTSNSRSAFVDAIDIGAGGLMSKADTATVADLTDSLSGATSGYLAEAINGALEAATAGGEVHADNLIAALDNLTAALAEAADQGNGDADLAAALATITQGLAGGLNGDSAAVSAALAALAASLGDLLATANLDGIDREVLSQLRSSL